MKNSKTKRLIPKYVLVELCVLVVVLAGLIAYYGHIHIKASDTPPVIKIEAKSDEFSVNATDDDLLKNISAYDNEDGDVTESIIIESISQLFNKNHRTVTYVAFDSNNNVTKIDRDITYFDYKSPTFTNNVHIYVPTGSTSEILAQLSAKDVIDGDISSQIKLEVNNVVRDVPGDYPVVATVTNSCGDIVGDRVLVTVTGEAQ